MLRIRRNLVLPPPAPRAPVAIPAGEPKPRKRQYRRSTPSWNAWPEESKATLLKMWPDYSVAKIAEVIGKSENLVWRMAHRMGLRKRKVSHETARELYIQHNRGE